LKLAALALAITLAMVLLGLGPVAQADSDNSTVELTVEVVPPPPPPEEGEYEPPPAPPHGTTDVRGEISAAGVFLEPVTAISEDELVTLTIPSGTVGLTEDLEPLTEITILEMDEPPSPPEDAHVIGLAYDFGPDGAIFEPPITLTWSYNPADIPEGIAEEDLVIAMWDEEAGEWVELEDFVVDTENNTITAAVAHFTTFAIIGAVTPPPPPVLVPPPPPPPPAPLPVPVTPPAPAPAPAPVPVPAPVPAPEPSPEPAPPEEVPELPAPPPPNWPLIGGLIAGPVILGLLIYFLVRRRAHLKIKDWLQRVKLPKRN